MVANVACVMQALSRWWVSHWDTDIGKDVASFQSDHRLLKMMVLVLIEGGWLEAFPITRIPHLIHSFPFFLHAQIKGGVCSGKNWNFQRFQCFVDPFIQNNFLFWALGAKTSWNWSLLQPKTHRTHNIIECMRKSDFTFYFTVSADENVKSKAPSELFWPWPHNWP